MSDATIIKFAAAKRQRRRARRTKSEIPTQPPGRFIEAAEDALRMIGIVLDDDQDDDTRYRRRCEVLLSDARAKLERSIAAYTESAQQDFRHVVTDALGDAHAHP